MIATVLVICLSLINIILWVIFFAAYKKTFSPEKLLGDIRQEVDKLLIEISREADADITLLEERRRGLKALLDEADRRILLAEKQQRRSSTEKKVLEELHEAAAPGTQSGQTAQTDLFDVEVVISDEARSLSLSAEAATERGGKAAQNGRLQPAAAAAAVPVENKSASPTPSAVQGLTVPQVLAAGQKLSLKEQINELHRAGLSIEQISSRLRISQAAVELAIAVGG